MWPWLALAGLGAFHGLNPAMGWLFAVALGLHRGRRSIVYLSLLPLALGHAVSVAALSGAATGAGVFFHGRFVSQATAVLLAGWALYHARYGHRHRVRFGMQTGMSGLFVWSFLMASAHGAGLMLVPALASLCLGAGPAADTFVRGPLAVVLLGVSVHTAAMLAITAAAAALIYEWVGLAVLRHAWFNVDVLWVAALLGTAVLLVFW
ncbi:MAG: hypothetical protein ACREC6_01610 [Hyphomicrobiaceae bacterium]